MLTSSYAREVERGRRIREFDEFEFTELDSWWSSRIDSARRFGVNVISAGACTRLSAATATISHCQLQLPRAVVSCRAMP